MQGDKHTIESLIVNIYGDQASPQFSDAELSAQFMEYRRYIVETYRYLDFKGIDGLAEAVKGSGGLTLESVYVPLRARLDTPDGESWHRIGGRFYCGAKAMADVDSEKMEQEILRAEAAALPVEQWVNQQQALLILGDPGSGKSTSMKRLALGLAQSEDAPLPILVPLNAYSKQLERGQVSFEDYLPEYFHGKRTQLEKSKLKQLFAVALQQQKAFILMDGLDEVGDNRGEVVAQVESFVRAWIPDPDVKEKSGNRMVVTSRFVGYRDFPLRDPRWQTVALNDWNEEEIGRFFKGFTYAAELAWRRGEVTEDAERLAKAELQSLLQVIERNTGIRRLSGNPLLASLLALIKRQGVSLPHRRVELYNLYMGTLLRSWNRSRSLDQQPIGPEIDFSPTQRLLAKLALYLRETNPQGGLIREQAMRDYLLKYYQDDGYSRKEADEQSKGFLDSVHKYSNLLIEKGYEQYGFIHLTFEEYLAGFGLALERETVLCKKIPEMLERAEHWKETLLLSLGVMAVVNTDVEKANGILEDLLESGEPQYILFVGEALNDIGASVLGNKMTRSIQKYLLQLMQDETAEIEVRAKAGRVLSDVGDPREGVTVKRLNGVAITGERGERKHQIPDIDWQEIPAGCFKMGTEGDEGYGQEKPAHDVDMKPFFISRYPVTNAQYRCFIEAGMYEDKAFWREQLPETAGKWLSGEMVGEDLLESYPEDHRVAYKNWLKNDKDRLQPHFWRDRRWNKDNHPVVGVSWFEALAYSTWLNDLEAELRPDSVIGDKQIRLPTEDEWEYAACGTTGLHFSWGNNADGNQGNYEETKLGRTSSVGMFSAGQAFGLHDVSGNVWEWSQSRWGKRFDEMDFPYRNWEEQNAIRNLLDPVELRVMRGGSWFDTSADCRCAVRGRLLPNYRLINLGFRVVMV